MSEPRHHIAGSAGLTEARSRHLGLFCGLGTWPILIVWNVEFRHIPDLWLYFWPGTVVLMVDSAVFAILYMIGALIVRTISARSDGWRFIAKIYWLPPIGLAETALLGGLGLYLALPVLVVGLLSSVLAHGVYLAVSPAFRSEPLAAFRARAWLRWLGSVLLLVGLAHVAHRRPVLTSWIADHPDAVSLGPVWPDVATLGIPALICALCWLATRRRGLTPARSSSS